MRWTQLLVSILLIAVGLVLLVIPLPNSRIYFWMACVVGSHSLSWCRPVAADRSLTCDVVQRQRSLPSRKSAAAMATKIAATTTRPSPSRISSVLT